MNQSLVERFNRTLKSSMRAGGPTGMVAAVRHGPISWQGAIGFQDIDMQTPLDVGSCFLIYSVSKTFTAALVLKLVDAGKLELDSQLRLYLPHQSIPPKVTVRQLLNHTSGIPDYGRLTEYHQAVMHSPSQPWSQEEFLARTLRCGLDFPPGGGWQYSNIGFMLLRLLAEELTGQSFAGAINDWLLRPLNLRNTFVPCRIDQLKDLVPGHSAYLARLKGTVDARTIYHPGWVATGVLASTAADTARFLGALFGGEVISHPLLEEMMHVIRVAAEHPRFASPSYGLGLMADPNNKLGAIYGHTGEGPGYSAAAYHIQELNKQPATVSVLCNSEAVASVEGAALDLFSILSEHSA